MRIGSATPVESLPRSARGGPKAGEAKGGGASMKEAVRSIAWSVFLPQPRSDITVLSTTEPELYDLSGVVDASARKAAPQQHFINRAEYQSRRFLIAEGRDIAQTLHAKAIAAPGSGFIDEFNVGGGQGLPRDLIAQDLQNGVDGWFGRNSDVQRVRGLSIPLCHYGLGTFGHFMLDALLQIFVFRDSLASGEARLLHWPLPSPWMSPVLDACGIPISARQVVSKPIVLMERAGLSSALAGHGVYFPSSLSLAFMDWLRGLFNAPASAGLRRLYIRRSSIYGRVIKNTEALEALLVRYGFEIVFPEDLTVADQIRLFADAGVVMSPWGSGLALAPLLSGPRCVIEILPSSVTDVWFSRQAAVHKLNYKPIVQASDEAGNMTVDVAAIENALSSLPH